MWELFPKMNKRVVPNKAMLVGKKSQKKKNKNVTLLLGTSEYPKEPNNFSAILSVSSWKFQISLKVKTITFIK